MDDHIIKAAREAGWNDLQLSMAAPAEIERLSRFYAIAFKAGMERAAEICEFIAADGYGMADMLEYGECANAIRAHAQNHPKPIHDSSVV